MDKAFIRLQSIRHSYESAAGPVLSVDGIDLDVAEHEFVALIGPSGCGKSTLLNLVAGVLTPSVGSVFYRHQLVTEVNTAVGYATQRDTLLPWRTVAENIGLALEIRGVSATERKEKVAQAVRQIGLTGFENHYPDQLSGGMRRRVLIARTMIYSPETLLLDEPFGALDAQNRLVMQSELLRLWQQLRQTVLFVTHDLDEAIALADRIVVLTARPGRVKLTLPVELPRPRDVVEIRHLPTYRDTYKQLWESLQQEVILAQ